MAVTCDGCGTDKEVKRAFIRVWNGTVADLCKRCAMPLVELIDGLSKDGWLTREGESRK